MTDVIPSADRPTHYQIKVLGWLDMSWSDWFGGLTLQRESTSDGTPITTLSGVVIDQPALHGLLERIRNLNLTLLSVARIEPDSEGVTASPERR
jgi:hypothetical protein